jgi:hypothetical protein
MKIDKRSTMGRFVEHVVPGVVRPLRVLWHEIIGFVFIVWPCSSSASQLSLLQAEEISILHGGSFSPLWRIWDHILLRAGKSASA